MTLKACVFGALASLLAVSAASAADLPSVKGPAPYAPPPPSFTWTGWHFGIVGGYGGGTGSYASNFWSVAPAAGFAQHSANTSGFVVGFNSGYLWQFHNNIVLGYESDQNYSDVRGENTGLFGGANQRMEWFGTERLRIGYAFGRVLPYVTGGLGYAHLRANGVDFIGGYAFPTSRSMTQAGWTVGAGLEYAIWGNVSVKAEYLFMRLPGVHGFGGGFPGAYRTFNGRDFDTHLARVGVNLHFSSLGSALNLIGIQGF